MKKLLEIDSYKKGYDTDNLNCMDFPIAAGAGYYNYEYYYYYCFYHGAYYNWGNIKNPDRLTFRNDILRKLGLILKPISVQVQDSNSIMKGIQAELEKNHPVVMVVNYYSLFYYHGYMQEKYREQDHGILINGYDTDRSILYIKEYSHIEKDMTAYTNTYVLFDFILTEDMVVDIWKKSNEMFTDEDSERKAKIYYVESIREPSIKNYKELVEDFFDIFDLNNDVLANYIKHYPNNMDLSVMENAIRLKKVCVNSLKVIFDVIKRGFPLLEEDKASQEEYTSLMDDFIGTREKITNILIANAIRQKEINKDRENQFIDQITQMNYKLFNYLSDLYKKTYSERNHS